jgi:hypothetical protein
MYYASRESNHDKEKEKRKAREKAEKAIMKAEKALAKAQADALKADKGEHGKGRFASFTTRDNEHHGYSDENGFLSHGNGNENSTDTDSQPNSNSLNSHWQSRRRELRREHHSTGYFDAKSEYSVGVDNRARSKWKFGWGR